LFVLGSGVIVKSGNGPQRKSKQKRVVCIYILTNLAMISKTFKNLFAEVVPFFKSTTIFSYDKITNIHTSLN